MKEQIQKNLGNASALEGLYRAHKKAFEKAFQSLEPEIQNQDMKAFWQARLNYTKESVSVFQWKQLLPVLLVCTLTAILIKLPLIFSFNPETVLFYERNAALLVLLSLSLYRMISHSLPWKASVLALLVFIFSALYINLLPLPEKSDSLNLAYLHLPLLLWCVYGLVFGGFRFRDVSLRMGFVKYNGDLAILMALLFTGGMFLSGITVALFQAIDVDVEDFYFNNIGLIGLVCIPVVASYVLKTFPRLTQKIAPVVAQIFSPLVLVMLVIYLGSIFYLRKDPYNDRDFLLLFNLLLIGVMAIIVFGVSESGNQAKNRFSLYVLILLTAVTLLIDGVALSAIIYRLGSYGFTPNRTVVLLSNAIMFVNLIFLFRSLARVLFQKASVEQVEQSMSRYLPVYLAYSILVVFLLPFLFAMA